MGTTIGSHSGSAQPLHSQHVYKGAAVSPVNIALQADALLLGLAAVEAQQVSESIPVGLVLDDADLDVAPKSIPEGVCRHGPKGQAAHPARCIRLCPEVSQRVSAGAEAVAQEAPAG